ncbi:hypothetical protein [Candidatus Lokiarchaeum ossiferum]|uniref:hypothetical protein n=1 Tax=Candidatus Lokiarchaeum ossiferum TaxID=2951803 RepID=UPI00352D815C
MRSVNKILIMVISSAILPGISALNSVMANELEENQTAIYQLRTIDQLNISQKRISNMNEIDDLVTSNAQEIRTLESNMATWLSKEEDRISDETKDAMDYSEQILSEEIDEYDKMNDYVVEMIGDCDYISSQYRQILEVEVRSLDIYLQEMVSANNMNITAANATLRREIYDSLFYANSLYKFSEIRTTPQVREIFYTNSSNYENLTVGIIEQQNLTDVFPSALDFTYPHTFDIINKTYTDHSEELFGNFYILQFNISKLWNMAELYFEARWASIWEEHDSRTETISNDEYMLRSLLYNQWNASLQEIELAWQSSDKEIQNLTTKLENDLFEFSQMVNAKTDDKEQFIVIGLNQERSKLSISISFMGFAITLLGTAADVKKREVAIATQPPKHIIEGDKALVQGISESSGLVEIAPTKSEIMKMYIGPIIAMGLLIAGLIFTYTALKFYLDYSGFLA